MRLYDELFKTTENALTRCCFVPGGGAYFEGVKAVGDFSPQRVIVCFPRVEVEATGEGLAIKKYCDGDLELSGRILSLRVVGPSDVGAGASSKAR